VEIRTEPLAPDAELIVATGALDWNATPELRRVLDDLYGRDVYKIVFDGSGVSYISSGCFGLLIEAQSRTKIAAGKLVFLNPSDPLREIGGLLGSNHLIATASSREEALKLLK
jgi:anti-anti-sigma factor